MTIWPESLPQKPLRGLSETRQKASLRSDMDSGGPKKRRRFTAAIRNVDVPIVFTQSERATFDTFYNDTLAEGVTVFDWAALQTDIGATSGTLSFGFRNPPRMIKVAGEWSTTLNLEVIP